MNRNGLNIVGITALIFGILGFFAGVKYQMMQTPPAVPGAFSQLPPATSAIRLPPQPVEQVPIQDPSTGRAGRIAGIDAPIDARHPQGTVYPP